MGKTQKPKPKTKKGKSGSSTSSKTNPKGGAFRHPHILVGQGTHKLTKEANTEMARRKIWVSQDGTKTNYENLDEQHLDHINKMLEEDRAPNRTAHKDSIKQETLRRSSDAGQILYGEKVNKKKNK